MVVHLVTLAEMIYLDVFFTLLCCCDTLNYCLFLGVLENQTRNYLTGVFFLR